MAETQLADVFVEMADTLVDDFDVIEFLHVLTERCAQLLDISAAGLLLTDGHGTPATGRCLVGTHPAARAVPAANRSGALCGLLPHRPTGVGRRPVGRPAVAA